MAGRSRKRLERGGKSKLRNAARMSGKQRTICPLAFTFDTIQIPFPAPVAVLNPRSAGGVFMSRTECPTRPRPSISEGFFVHRRIRLHAASTVGLAARAAAGIPAVREPGTVTLMGSCGGSHPSADLRPDEVSAAI